MMNSMYPPITWVDVETDGLDENENYLLEVACLVTDTELNILDEAGYHSAIYYPPNHIKTIKEEASELVLQMHEQTGLWERLEYGKPLYQVDVELLSYIKQFNLNPQISRLGGNSISLDRAFLRKNLSQTYEYIHYRSIDVSTVAELAEYWYGVKYSGKTYSHNAFKDIKESIEELKFYRDQVFK